MSENVSSNVLFHFTRSIENLKGILRNGFSPRFCPEFTLDPTDRKAAATGRHPMRAIPMICFCDLPMSVIRKHLREYGYYGIGLDKEWGLESGLSPVTYTHPRARTRKSLMRLATRAAATKDGVGQADLKLLAAYTKPFLGPAWRNNRVQKGVQFYDEREWRYVPEPMFLEWRDYVDEATRMRLHKKLAKTSSLKVPPDVIQYLILPFEKGERNIIRLHDYLKRIYARKDAILVSTAIMTVDRIEEDI